MRISDNSFDLITRAGLYNFFIDTQIYPIAIKKVLSGIVVQCFNIEVRIINTDVCHSPGDAVIMTADNEGLTGNSHTGHIDFTGDYTMHLIPDAGCPKTEVHVVAHDRGSVVHLVTVDGPVVASMEYTANTQIVQFFKCGIKIRIDQGVFQPGKNKRAV